MNHVESFRDAVDEVAREGRFLAALEAPPLESAHEFVSGNINGGNPQFVAVTETEVIGWCDIVPKERAAFRHVGVLGMGVRKKYRGQGIGTQLLDMTVAAAWEKEIKRIELVVRVDNAGAKTLYDRAGFMVEGVLRKDLYIGDEYHDSYLMALLNTA